MAITITTIYSVQFSREDHLLKENGMGSENIIRTERVGCRGDWDGTKILICKHEIIIFGSSADKDHADV